MLLSDRDKDQEILLRGPDCQNSIFVITGMDFFFQNLRGLVQILGANPVPWATVPLLVFFPGNVT